MAFLLLHNYTDFISIMSFHLKVIIDNIELIIVNKEPIILMIPSIFKLMLSFLFLKFNKNSTKDKKNIGIDSDIKIINTQIYSLYIIDINKKGKPETKIYCALSLKFCSSKPRPIKPKVKKATAMILIILLSFFTHSFINLFNFTLIFIFTIF